MFYNWFSLRTVFGRNTVTYVSIFDKAFVPHIIYCFETETLESLIDGIKARGQLSIGITT